MKAEHRKELKTNTLVATLKSVGQGLKEGPSRRTVVVTGIILLVGLLVVIWVVVKNASDKRASHRWEQLYTSSTMDDLKAFRENYGDNYPRLVKLKNQYDPMNLFRLNANVVPTA